MAAFVLCTRVIGSYGFIQPAFEKLKISLLLAMDFPGTKHFDMGDNLPITKYAWLQPIDYEAWKGSDDYIDDAIVYPFRCHRQLIIDPSERLKKGEGMNVRRTKPCYPSKLVYTAHQGVVVICFHAWGIKQPKRLPKKKLAHHICLDQR
jgi:hypothetical protein